MKIMKTMCRKSMIAISLFVFFNLAGCTIGAKFSSPTGDGVSDDYEAFHSFDIRELEEQIPGYWSYVEQNEEEQKRMIREAEMWDTDWITGGTYLVGQDIAEGLYIVWKGASEEDIWIGRQDESGEMWEDLYWDRYTEVSYLYLAEGEHVRLPHGDKMALADSGSPSPAAEKNGVYYEGSYRVGEDIPEGEYFAVDIGNQGGSLMVDRVWYLPFPNTRFVYFTLSNTKILTTKDYIVFPADHKPQISPIRYQGIGEGKGSFVYPNGMYKIGEDLPVGTYKIKNEVYHGVYDLSYEGYHGNVSSYDPENWCGLEIHSSADPDRIKTSLDRTIELDNRVNEALRSVRIRKNTFDGLEFSYKYFWGLPTITFTERDIGTYVSVERCILIPEEIK